MKSLPVLFFIAFACCLFSCERVGTVVYPSLETEPVSSLDDAADDPAIFVHPTDPGKSAIIGTDKQRGLVVFDTAGKIVHKYDFGRINNVDLRQIPDWNGMPITLVGGSNRSDNSIVFYRLNEETLELMPLHDRPIPSAVDEVYGFCLYNRTQPYAFVVGKNGVVEQWELIPPDSSRQFSTVRVRSFDVGGQCEGLVADDELGWLYVGEEDVGIWKYGAGPADGDRRTSVQLIKGNKHLKADLEGLTIYYGENGAGYLIASSQGNKSYAFYERDGDNRYIGSIRIEEKDGIDGISDTDGIDVTHQPFSSRFPNGVFVAQDDKNEGGKQNFKLVDWARIEQALR